MSVQTLMISGKKFALVPFREFERLAQRAKAPAVPSLPKALPSGNYPAREALRAIYARKLIQERAAAGLSQAKLARKAGLRVETVSRLERGKHIPDLATAERISRALHAAGMKN